MWLSLARFSYLLHLLLLLNCTTCVHNSARMMILECFQLQVDLRLLQSEASLLERQTKPSQKLKMEKKNHLVQNPV